jgi:hypothetical protein
MVISEKQIQQIIDSFSIGKLTKSYQLDSIIYTKAENKILIQRHVVETSHGLFFLCGSKDKAFQHLWWSLGKNKFTDVLKKIAGIEYAKSLKTQPHKTDADHRFDCYFVLFAL